MRIVCSPLAFPSHRLQSIAEVTCEVFGALHTSERARRSAFCLQGGSIRQQGACKFSLAHVSCLSGHCIDGPCPLSAESLRFHYRAREFCSETDAAACSTLIARLISKCSPSVLLVDRPTADDRASNSRPSDSHSGIISGTLISDRALALSWQVDQVVAELCPRQ